ncbi:MAG: hypothetical protein JWL66_863 [Sphingomonadales bacterium]|nr:hypothetical protein [Sphingomonadales bacterium]
MTNTFTVADRVEIADLFARYCHRVDRSDATGWAALFTLDGVFEVEGVFGFAGADELIAMPGVVADQGGGKWRHQITNLAIDAGPEPDTATVVAYGLVTDWGEGGKLVSFTDYEVALVRVDGGWRIRRLIARMP